MQECHQNKLMCPICHKQFSSKSNMNRHLKQHLPHANEFYSCPQCMKSFKRKDTLKAHMD